jgi:hypothetical protein
MWYRGNFSSTAAGQGLAKVWDALVDGYDNWSVYDAAAGTNAKVYRCYDPDSAENNDFYVLVNDNFVGYWTIQLWEGWDAGAHTGIGDHIEVSSSTYVFTGRRPVGGFYLAINGHRLIYIETMGWTAQYIGQPRRYSKTYNTPLICSYSSGAIYVCPMSYIGNSAQSACRWLWDEAGNQALVRGDGGQTASNYRILFGIDGRFHFPGEKIVSGQTTGYAIGTLDGVVDLGGGSQVRNMRTGHLFQLRGEDWLVVTGSYGTYYGAAVRMA